MKSLIITALAVTTLCSFNSPVDDQFKVCFNEVRKVFVDTNEQRHRELTEAVLAKYDVSDKLARQVVKLAIAHESKTFPRASDIIAIVGIESSFNPNAVSKLKTDPAVGLTQVRPKAWSHKLKPEDLQTVDGQIRSGSMILSDYYRALNDRGAAIRAYNIGLTNYNKGKFKEAAERYITKYRKEVNPYRQIEVKYAK